MPITSFDPTSEGFQFSNAHIQWTFGPFSNTQLCGGMSYAALDYYNSDFAIPRQTAVPVEKSTLHSYIYSRQIDAHLVTVPRFVGSWAPIIGPLMTEVPQSSEIEKLVQFMSSDMPIPICLVGRGNGHHVIAMAIDTHPLVIKIYDPNRPNETVTLARESNGFVHKSSHAVYRGFFVDDGYSFNPPPNLEGEHGWRMCYGCRGLYFGVAEDNACPVGNRHYALSRADYVLAMGGGRGEGGWRFCTRCKELVYALDATTPGVCPAGGIHTPSSHWKYALAVDNNANVQGQSNWYRCKTCQCVFFRGLGDGGLCPAGGAHDVDLTTRYRIPFV